MLIVDIMIPLLKKISRRAFLADKSKINKKTISLFGHQPGKFPIKQISKYNVIERRLFL